MKGIGGLLIACALMGTVLTGCSKAETAPTITTTTTTAPPAYQVDLNRVTEGGWALFGSMEINYKLGVEVNQDIKGYQPFFIVNRYTKAVEKKSITTDPGETTADIPIKKILTDGDIANVISIESNLDTDRLSVTGYSRDSSSLTITGFTPGANRVATIIYKPNTVFSVKVANDKKPKEGFVCAPDSILNYFEVEKETIEVRPDTYEPINYRINIPKDTPTPSHFEVWINAEPAYASGSGVDFIMSYFAPIKISMLN